MVPRCGIDHHELHQQIEGTKQRKKECGCGRKTTGSDGISTNTRERQVAVSNTKARECYGKDEGECPTSREADLGFLEEQLEVAESREMTMGRFVTAANEVTIGGFWREHTKGELRTRKDHNILKFLSPCWEKRYMAGVFCAKESIFGAFVQELLSMPISLLLALYLVYPRYLFNMGPAYLFSRGVETLRIDGYLALVLLTHGKLVSFHRLMK